MSDYILDLTLAEPEAVERNPGAALSQAKRAKTRADSIATAKMLDHLPEAERKKAILWITSIDVEYEFLLSAVSNSSRSGQGISIIAINASYSTLYKAWTELKLLFDTEDYSEDRLEYREE